MALHGDFTWFKAMGWALHKFKAVGWDLKGKKALGALQIYF